MQFPSPASPNRDQRLWQIAKAHTRFHSHLFVYAIINGGLWLLWVLLPESHGHREALPWPIWTSLFWGIGVALQGFAAYGNLNRGQRTQREYERLLGQHEEGAAVKI